MACLLDDIYEELEVEKLTRKRVEEYLLHLEELMLAGNSEERIKYLNWKVKLHKRKIAIDKDDVQKINAAIAEISKQVNIRIYGLAGEQHPM